MNIYIDERGPYLLELASNADARRRDTGGKWANYWAYSLIVSNHGHFAYGDIVLHDHKTTCRILFLPHMGNGEPRPQS